jgi:hypothetical protein
MVKGMIHDVNPVVEYGIRDSRERIWLAIKHRSAGEKVKYTVDGSGWDVDRKEKPVRLQATLYLMSRSLQDSKDCMWAPK